jgi:hypothetical protein
VAKESNRMPLPLSIFLLETGTDSKVRGIGYEGKRPILMSWIKTGEEIKATFSSVTGARARGDRRTGVPASFVFSVQYWPILGGAHVKSRFLDFFVFSCSGGFLAASGTFS